MKKRGQISLFILLGLMLVFVVGVYLVISSNSSEIVTDSRIYPTPSTPVEQFVASCMEETLKNGLTIVGIQGGYIDLPEVFDADRSLSISSHPFAPIRTPLWSDQGVSYMPPLWMVEDQLSEYVGEYIGVCLQNFSTIRVDQIDALSQPEVEVNINQEDVLVQMNYTLEFNDRASQVDNFVVQVPVRLRELFAIAEQVHDNLENNQFFDVLTIDLMATGDELIPMSGISFSCKEPVWSEQQVQEKISEVLYYNIPRVRVAGTNYAPFEEPEENYVPFAELSRLDVEGGLIPEGKPGDQYEYNHLFVDAGLDRSVGANKINIAFDYQPIYGMDMHVRPSDDGVMRGSLQQGGTTSYLDFFCMHVYHFTYDLSYPIMASVLQEDAFTGGEDFVLRFGIPVMIERNLPVDDGVTSSFAFGFETDQEFCGALSRSPTQIYAIDALTTQGINAANISFDCVRVSCELGQTTSVLNGVQRLDTFLPSGCFGGVVHAEKEGYLDAQVQIEGTEPTVEIPMIPLREVFFQVDLSPKGLLSVPLEAQQLGYVRLVQEEVGFDETFFFDPESPLPKLEVLEIPATYNMTVFVFEDSNLIAGYVGLLNVDEQNFNQFLNIHVYEELPHPTTAQQASDFYNFLQEGSYYSTHGGVWE